MTETMLAALLVAATCSEQRPWVALALDAASAPDGPEVAAQLRPQLDRRGLDLCLPSDLREGTATATLAGSWEPPTFTIHLTGLGAEAGRRRRVQIEADDDETRQEQMARALFAALAPTGRALATQASPDAPEDTRPSLRSGPGRVEVAGVGEFRGFIEGLSEVAGGAEVRFWMHPRWLLAARLEAGQVLSHTVATTSVDGWTLGGAAGVGWSFLPQVPRIDALVRAEIHGSHRELRNAFDSDTQGTAMLRAGVEGVGWAERQLAASLRAWIGVPLGRSAVSLDTGDAETPPEETGPLGFMIGGSFALHWRPSPASQ